MIEHRALGQLQLEAPVQLLRVRSDGVDAVDGELVDLGGRPFVDDEPHVDRLAVLDRLDLGGGDAREEVAVRGVVGLDALLVDVDLERIEVVLGRQRDPARVLERDLGLQVFGFDVLDAFDLEVVDPGPTVGLLRRASRRCRAASRATWFHADASSYQLCRRRAACPRGQTPSGGGSERRAVSSTCTRPIGVRVPVLDELPRVVGARDQVGERLGRGRAHLATAVAGEQQEQLLDPLRIGVDEPAERARRLGADVGAAVARQAGQQLEGGVGDRHVEVRHRREELAQHVRAQPVGRVRLAELGGQQRRCQRVLGREFFARQVQHAERMSKRRASARPAPCSCASCRDARRPL